jgi:hypothetical protein
MPLKVAKLPSDTITMILSRAEIPPEAPEVVRGGDSPVSKPQQLLPQGIIAALKKAQGGYPIEGDRLMVPLQSDEVSALSNWLRSLAGQPGMAGADRARLRDAANRVERAS